MPYSYSAGTTTPNLGGLAEFNGVRINDGTFEMHHLGGVLDSAPVRTASSSLPSDDGGFVGLRFYDPATIGLEGKLIVADYTQIGPALDQLRGAFNLNAGLQTLTLNYPGWASARQMTAFVSGQVTVNEPPDLEKLVPEREFVIPLTAPDPRLYNVNSTTTTITTGTTVTNNGTYPTPFVVQFTGAATNPSLTTAAGAISMTYSVASGHNVQVNTNPATTTGISALDGTTNVYGNVTTFTVYTIPPGTSTWSYTGGGSCTVTFRDAWA